MYFGWSTESPSTRRNSPDGGVDAVLEIDNGVVGPKLLLDFLACDEFPGVLDQNHQYPKRFFRQPDWSGHLRAALQS